jgi:RNA polymerase sigma-70 factor (ECF subfamily)
MMPEYIASPVREGLAVDTDGFDSFYRSTYPTLHRIAFAKCGRHALAEELVQESMLKVAARWSKVSKYDNPVAYCCRVVINESIGLRRRQVLEARALARRGVDVDTVIEPEADEFWSLVRFLPKRQMQVVVLYYAGDRSIADIGNTLGIAEGTVRATLAQARDALRIQLEGDPR